VATVDPRGPTPGPASEALEEDLSGDRRDRGGEACLLARHAKGDPGAFAELVARFRAPVYGYLVRWGVASDRRDDLFQEVFLKLHASAGRFDATRSAAAWIFAIVANTVRSHHRAANRSRELGETAAESEPVAAEPSGLEMAVARQTADLIEKELPNLPAAQREVILLCCVEDLSQQEVAEVLGLPIGTVKTHLRRGRLALARALSRRRLSERRS